MVLQLKQATKQQWSRRVRTAPSFTALYLLRTNREQQLLLSSSPSSAAYSSLSQLAQHVPSSTTAL